MPTSSDTILFKWPALADADYYEVQCENSTERANTIQIEITGLGPDTEYTFKIRAVNGSNVGD